MQYLWIWMLSFAYSVWTVSAIKDIIQTCRKKSSYNFKTSTGGWIIVTITILFIWSFISYIAQHLQ